MAHWMNARSCCFIDSHTSLVVVRAFLLIIRPSLFLLYPPNSPLVCNCNYLKHIKPVVKRNSESSKRVVGHSHASINSYYVIMNDIRHHVFHLHVHSTMHDFTSLCALCVALYIQLACVLITCMYD